MIFVASELLQLSVTQLAPQTIKSVFVMSCCRAVVYDVGDHALPEQSVLWSPDELCWADFVLPWFTQAVQILQSLTPPRFPPILLVGLPPSSPDHAFSTRAPEKLVAVDEFFSLVYAAPLPFKILSHYLFYSEPILIIFGRNVAKKLNSVKMLPYLMLSLAA